VVGESLTVKIPSRRRGRSRTWMWIADNRNTPAAEAGNATFSCPDGTSGDTAAGSASGRCRCGVLRQVGEWAPCGRNRRWCRCAGWRCVAGASTATGRQDKRSRTAAPRNRFSAFVIHHNLIVNAGQRHITIVRDTMLACRLVITITRDFGGEYRPDTFVCNGFHDSSTTS
jgi:hypothetical protein